MSGGVDGLPCGDTLRFAADAGSYTHRTCKKKKLLYYVTWLLGLKRYNMIISGKIIIIIIMIKKGYVFFFL